MADALTMWEELGKIDNTKVRLVLCFALQIVEIAAVDTIMLLWTLAQHSSQASYHIYPRKLPSNIHPRKLCLY